MLAILIVLVGLFGGQEEKAVSVNEGPDLERAAADLARLGYEVDLERVQVEHATKAELREALERQALLLTPMQGS